MEFQNLSSILLRKCYKNDHQVWHEMYAVRWVVAHIPILLSQVCKSRSAPPLTNVASRERELHQLLHLSQPQHYTAIALPGTYGLLTRPRQLHRWHLVGSQNCYLRQTSGRTSFASHLSPTSSKPAVYTPYLIVPGGCS